VSPPQQLQQIRLFAIDLGVFISAVRAIDTRGGTYDGSGRGGDLAAHGGRMQQCLQLGPRFHQITVLFGRPRPAGPVSVMKMLSWSRRCPHPPATGCAGKAVDV
jgi:hypothetical protein